MPLCKNAILRNIICDHSKSNGNKYSFAAVTKACYRNTTFCSPCISIDFNFSINEFSLFDKHFTKIL